MTMVYMYSGQNLALLKKYIFHLEIITRDLLNQTLHFIYFTAINPSPPLRIPVGLNFLFLNFNRKI